MESTLGTYSVVRRTDPDGAVTYYHRPDPEQPGRWAAEGTAMPRVVAEAVQRAEARRCPGARLELVDQP